MEQQIHLTSTLKYLRRFRQQNRWDCIMSVLLDCEDLLILVYLEVVSPRMLEKQGCRSHSQLYPPFFRCPKSLFQKQKGNC